MPAHAYIKFVYKSVSYTWEGQDPEDFSVDFAQVYQVASEALYESHLQNGFPDRLPDDQGAPMVDILKKMGATVTEIHSIRKNGAIKVEDLPLLKVY